MGLRIRKNKMKKLLLISSIALASLSFTSSTYYNVYICDSKTAKKYHLKKDCRGLSNCKSEVKKITLTKAKELKRTLCGWED